MGTRKYMETVFNCLFKPLYTAQSDQFKCLQLDILFSLFSLKQNLSGEMLIIFLFVLWITEYLIHMAGTSTAPACFFLDLPTRRQPILVGSCSTAATYCRPRFYLHQWGFSGTLPGYLFSWFVSVTCCSSNFASSRLVSSRHPSSGFLSSVTTAGF